jgi:hypothetical protein
VIRRLVAVAALAAVVTASAVLSSAVFSSAASAHEEALSLTVEDGPGVSIEIAAYGPSVLTAGDQLRVTANVSNAGSLAAIGLDVTLSVTKNPFRSSPALENFLEDPTSASLQLAAQKAVSDSELTVGTAGGALAPGSTVPVAIAAGSRALGMPANTAGVYGVLLAVEDASGVVAYRTAAITWYDAEISPLRVAFVASAAGSPERSSQVVSAASVPGAAVIVDPSTITDAMQASSLVSNREVFGLPTGDPDFTSIAHAQDRTLLRFAMNDARNNSQPVLQDLALLATIPVPDAPTIKLAAGQGAIAGILNVTGGSAVIGAKPVVDVTAGDVTLPVLVPNARLSTVLATYRPGMPDAAARLVAEAALVAQAGDGVTPVVVAPGTAWQLTGPGVSRPVTDLLDAPWVVPVSTRSVISGTARGSVTARELSGTSRDLSSNLISALARQLEDLEQLSLTAEDPNSIYVPGGRTLLRPLASSLRTDDDARTATYQSAREDVAATLAGLHVASGSDVNLIAASGNVPVTLQNDLDVDATVTVVMRSGSPNLVVEDAPVVTIPANGDVTALVAVTGVSSANVTATVALQNAEGDVVAAPQVLHVRVRADWGNAVTAVFTAVLALLLIAGVIRTIRRGRRSSRMAPMSAAEIDDAVNMDDAAKTDDAVQDPKADDD